MEIIHILIKFFKKYIFEILLKFINHIMITLDLPSLVNLLVRKWKKDICIMFQKWNV